MANKTMTDAGPGEAQADRVQMREIRRTYGMVTALDGANFRVAPGEVVGLVGDNGAGKSTLMKVLAGTVIPDSGEIWVDGRKVEGDLSPKAAHELGIEMVYQDLALCDDLDVPGNLFLGREPRRAGGLMLDKKKMVQEASEHLDGLNIHIQSLTVPVRNLSGGQRQAIAIARALTFNPRLLVLDEPTAALAVAEVGNVLRLIKEVAASGVGVVLITHRLQDLFEVCDRLCVLFAGRMVSDMDAKTTSLETLVSKIIAKEGGAI
jgi:simple sugar transport system ATP-binding protein